MISKINNTTIKANEVPILQNTSVERIRDGIIQSLKIQYVTYK
ncbi:hypothetical protein J6TS1_19380 [Siminovitchia terrae]|uniref:Uncharacterized protein n=1 Tax=Siminovitchia terrae TaxID=1914933 RepID=A0ABQ4KVL7_SIMTE|nr:hypothetical protein J6TS1_19380 [Siminovitchia terrae]